MAMVKDLSKYKTELTELARVINQFKSEAVQVRLLELLLTGNGETDSTDGKGHAGMAGLNGATIAHRPPKKRKMGAMTAILSLVEAGFFADRRRIAEIAAQSKDSLHVEFDTNELSGPLARLVQEEKLKRDKKNGYFQYYV